ncbi:ABC-2 type transport system ATP-binding protein [Antricoccus suffuscus]|uniref:ABC-2 type transport system ATP-binding protein n=1 Tax=Antricoccus suffuscus TaxID=1629062 RepID=A0A2T1A628_9ACTN|nr:ABC transporter ATP-binding protein [Antricoccus suffuscus]PRZ44051.1 ABC-2 type transport system ATP-binding protein [Antricoccus suffuscus]
MTPPVVVAEKISRSFGGHLGIDQVSLEIAQGEVFGFLGPNGAGKSTTIRILLGLYRRDAGRVEVFGLDPARHAPEVHRLTGYLPGELALYSRLSGRQHLQRVAGARGQTDTAYRDELVERFGVELDRPVRTLSKGNRQKIGIVLAFMHRPDLLILDEPTSGLDPLLQGEFARLVRETADDGRTVFLSSHELDEVQRLADRVAIIREGNIAVTDTVQALRRAAPRTIELRFDRSVDPAQFAALEGVRVTNNDSDQLTLSVTGAVAPVLALAAQLDALDISARRADLDELFLTYYRDQPAGSARHGC